MIMRIAVLGLERNCVSSNALSCNGDINNATAIIDLNGGLRNLDIKAQLIITQGPEAFASVKRRIIGEVAVGSMVLRTLIGLGELNGDVVIKGTKGEAFGVSLNGKVILFARPLLIYLLHDPEPLVNEVKLLLNSTQSGVSVDDVVKELVSMVISERRNKKVSRTLAYLEEFLQDGDIGRLPPYILDALASVGAVQGNSVNRELIERIINEVRARVYPRRS
ncbi:hypothetical protein [Vulcanisaeta souniana]|uniref:Uncharacterized protein n=2 Tax=Vulcanisaeta souniana JCM 11219 TaxID=1293586 RepID=A0ABM8BLB8_9CREN|nr:hypothetical protein [Vulcanisaeta souniana]BDR91779.1 hypothetical protein Vsou_08720 [Vulcanisaeta souniana JCM 11219]